MSVVISPTNWSDHLSSLSSRASLLDQTARSRHSGESRRGQIQAPRPISHETHQFELQELETRQPETYQTRQVNYAPETPRQHRHNHGTSHRGHGRRPISASEIPSNPNPRYSLPVSGYDMERNFYSDEASSEAHEASPLITIINEGLPRRSGSIISESASLRHRNTIRQRNRMVKREVSVKSTTSNASGNSKNGKIKKKNRYVFPIRRKASYRYVRPRKFNSQTEVDQYFEANNISAVMKDILPKTMNSYEYQHILRLEPELASQPVTIRSPRLVQQPVQANRLSKVKFGQELDRPARKTPPESRGKPMLSDPNSFVGTVYRKYREVALAGQLPRGSMPSTVEESLPLESELMNYEERDTLNSSLLFEILMRRTVAAKIDFRLKRSGIIPDQELFRNDSTGSSAPSSSTGSNSHSIDSKHHTKSSENLPSPQISSTSQDKSVSSRNVRSGGSFATNNLKQRQSFSKMPESLSRIPEDTNVPELKLPENFPNDISSNTNSQDYTPDNTNSAENQEFQNSPFSRTAVNSHVGSVQLAFLQPWNRSQDTFSSFSSMTDTSLPGNWESGDELFRSGISGDTLCRKESPLKVRSRTSPREYRPSSIFGN